MTVISRSLHNAALWPGIHAFYGKTYKEIPEQYSQIFDNRTSDKAYEKIVESTTFGLPQTKYEGQAIAYQTDGEGYTTTLTNVVYGMGYMCSREEIEDNQYESKSKQRARSLAYSMKTSKEMIHAAILNNAFDTAFPIGDGAALCSVSHPTMAGNQANKPATDADLSEASLEDAVTSIRLMTNARGLKHYFRPKKLLVPPALGFTAERLLKSELRTNTANNDINALRSMSAIPGGFMIYDYLTDADAWFLLVDVPEGLLTFQRRAVELERDNDFDTENAKAKTTERFVAGCADWRAVWGTAGAA